MAVEVNLSCPNLEDRRHMFAHSPAATRAAMEATAGCRRPRWAKLSPTTPELPEVAVAARDGGAEAVTLVNTLLGMVLDPSHGPSGAGQRRRRAVRPGHPPVAVRAVFDVRGRAPRPAHRRRRWGGRPVSTRPSCCWPAPQAVQVGTATFADPRAPARVLAELRTWVADRGPSSVADVVGAAHRGGLP